MISSAALYGDRYSHNIDGLLALTMTRSARRGPWLPEEDQALLRLVRTQGANNWVRISQQLQHRSPKQCRERYHQNLKPSLKHDPISAQEGELIERLVQEMGKRWAEIARRLGNRSDNAVKNWWNGSVNRRRRNPAPPTSGFKQVGSRIQPLPFDRLADTRYSQRQSIAFDSTTTRSVTNPYEVPGEFPKDHRHSLANTVRPVHPRASSMAGIAAMLQSAPYTHNSAQPSSAYEVDASQPRPELPPLRSTSFHHAFGDRLHAAERHPISPVLSDTSQRHAPSLVSDNQSMYSISPRTVTTPRPGLLAPVEPASSNWLNVHSGPGLNPSSTSHQTGQSSSKYSRQTNQVPLDPKLHQHSISSTGEERPKDSRMNVSTLLQ